MLEVGKAYEIVMLEDDFDSDSPVEAHYLNCTVMEVQWPVVRFGPHPFEKIFNLSSPRFVKAIPLDD